MSNNMFGWALGADRIVVLTMDDETQSTNTMTDRCLGDFTATVDRLEAERDAFDGVILTSAKDTFFAGGDLTLLMNAGPDDVDAVADVLDSYKAAFRRLETLGKPVVAAINGTALGGGFEFALACHHRIVLDRKGCQLGLPEVTLGILPGAGGVTRVVRLIGVMNALLNVIGQGQRMKPAKALQTGIIDAVVESEAELFARAREWITAHPEAKQPWDVKGFRIPGGTPSSAALAANLPGIPGNLRKQLKGAPMAAPIAVVAAATEGAQVDIDTAFTIETRYATNLICGQISTNMIKALFFDLNAVNKGTFRPSGYPVRCAEKVAVLGAGMMGAGIAYVTAMSGARVVLRDLTIEAAERGKDYSRGLLSHALSKGRISQDEHDAVLDRITATDNLADIKDADLVVEAVFEDLEIKRNVFAEAEPYVAVDALLGTNTSALPIAELVSAVSRPADFLGLHFFSPVDKMPLLEIVVGSNTSDEALARAFDFAAQIKKSPIAVKDVFAFYANRVITQFIEEALTLLGDGVHPASIEQAATQAGFPVGPLALLDEVNMMTTIKIQRSAIAADAGGTFVYYRTAGTPVMSKMVDEFDRPGRLARRGFYEYEQSGKRLQLWPQLLTEFHRPDLELPFEDIKERMLFAAAIEGARCIEQGIVRTVADANIGSILGTGFPVWTGGVLQYINQYDGGLAGFVARADALCANYGKRFEIPESLRRRAAAGTRYCDTATVSGTSTN